MNVCSWTGVLLPATVAGIAVSSATANDGWGLLAAAGAGAAALAWRRWGGGAPQCAVPVASPTQSHPAEPTGS